MTLKNAALLALIGTALETVLLVAGLITNIEGVTRGITPDRALLTSLIYVVANLSLLVFLFVFHRAQS